MLADYVSELQKVLGNLPAVVMGVVGPQFKKQGDAVDARCSPLESDIAQVKKRIASAEPTSAANSAAAKILATKVSAAEAVSLQEFKAAAAVDEFDRIPNPAHLKIRVGDRNGRIELSAVEHKVREIAAEIPLAPDGFQVHRPKLRGICTVNCAKTGSTGIGEKRAKSRMEYLYNHGDWRPTTIDDPSGKSQRCFFEKDKNKRQSMCEGLTRKAFAILKEYYPSLASQFQCVSRDGKVYHAGQHLARVVVDGPSNAHLEWCKGAESAGIDREKITSAWLQQGRIDDGAEWVRV